MSEFESRLPTFVAARSKDYPKFLVVWCSREDCVANDKRPFLVAEAEWMRPRKRTSTKGTTFAIVGRTCPYCFRASKLPSRKSLAS